MGTVDVMRCEIVENWVRRFPPYERSGVLVVVFEKIIDGLGQVVRETGTHSAWKMMSDAEKAERAVEV